MKKFNCLYLLLLPNEKEISTCKCLKEVLRHYVNYTDMLFSNCYSKNYITFDFYKFACNRYRNYIYKYYKNVNESNIYKLVNMI